MRAFVRTLALWLAFWPAMSGATVNELVPPTSGIFTGVQFSQKIGDAFRSLASCNKGPTAPANVDATSIDGLCWIDDSVSPWIIKKYVNGGWAVLGALDPTDSSFAGVIGGGIATIASGATVDLGSVPQANVLVTGAATITSFGGSAPTGIEKTIRFDDVSVITPSVVILVPGGFPLTTAAGDRAKVTHLGSGNWEITTFTRTSGIPVDISAVGKPEFTFATSVPPLHVAGYGQALARASYPAYLAATTRVQNGTRISGNATIAGIADTSGFGAGMPVESTGVNGACTIASVVANTSITLNSAGCVTSSGTSPVTVFPHGYGTGGNTTTVGVEDCRNRTLAGRDRNDPGSLAGLLTTATSGFGANSGIYGAKGGHESQALALTQLPTGIQSANPAQVGLSVGTGALSQGWVQTTLGTGLVTAVVGTTPNPGNATVIAVNGLSSQFLTAVGNIPVNGVVVTSFNTSGQAHPIVSPTMIADCIVRVTP